ncbi:hypothetical protein [Amycolatopsis jejuensis]|uniref:hypothetical protein n=1 Tax=Amycolatopsis jejuensis TaxID=330084 RepID=UPI0005260417|nr:hypothetical protein [Amycolatopsis jejuensis]
MTDRIEDVRALLADPPQVGELPLPVVQQLLALAVRHYAAAADVHAAEPAFPDEPGTPGVTATEAVIAVSGILKQLNIELFELAMWQTRAGHDLPTNEAGATS